MKEFKPFTMYYFSCDGRNGLAHISEGRCIDTDDDYGSYVDSVASASLSDIHRLIYTFRSPGVDNSQMLSILYSIKNIVDSELHVFCCKSERECMFFVPKKVSDIVELHLTSLSDDASEDVLKCVSQVRSFLASLDSMIDVCSKNLVSSVKEVNEEVK